jgi:hypothetical protein
MDGRMNSLMDRKVIEIMFCRKIEFEIDFIIVVVVAIVLVFVVV